MIKLNTNKKFPAYRYFRDSHENDVQSPALKERVPTENVRQWISDLTFGGGAVERIAHVAPPKPYVTCGVTCSGKKVREAECVSPSFLLWVAALGTAITSTASKLAEGCIPAHLCQVHYGLGAQDSPRASPVCSVCRLSCSVGCVASIGAARSWQPWTASSGLWEFSHLSQPCPRSTSGDSSKPTPKLSLQASNSRDLLGSRPRVLESA